MPNTLFVPPKDKTIQKLKYNEHAYGENTYPAFFNDPGFEFLPQSVVYFTYKVLNSSAYYIEKYITVDRNLFTKIELKWNYVRNAKMYAIYKGKSDKNLELVTYVKDNFWYDTDTKEEGVYYQIRPLFTRQFSIQQGGTA